MPHVLPVTTPIPQILIVTLVIQLVLYVTVLLSQIVCLVNRLISYGQLQAAVL